MYCYNKSTSHLNDFQLLPSNQSAYRQNYFTETALLCIRDDLLMSTDAGLLVGNALLHLGLSAAFDTVDHPILLKRLETSVSVSGTALRWFTFYLESRTQSVKARKVIAAPRSLLYESRKARCSSRRSFRSTPFRFLLLPSSRALYLTSSSVV